MRKLVFITMCGCLLTNFASADEVWQEAELFENASISPMVVASDIDASSGQFIWADESVGNSNTDPPSDGRATYTINVAGGVYTMFMRCRVRDSDSCWVHISGWSTAAGSPASISRGDGWVKWDFTGGTSDPWHWTNLRNQDQSNDHVHFNLAPGIHTVTIARREDGSQMDGWIITSDVNTNPDDLPDVIDPLFNSPPQVNAGLDQRLTFSAPSIKVSLQGTVADDGKPLPNTDPPIPNDPNKLTFSWSITGNPAGSNPTFENGNTTILDPNIIIDQVGTYQLLLSAGDGEKDANDTALIVVLPEGQSHLIAYWDFEEGRTGDVLTDQSDGVLEPNMTNWGFDGPYKHDLDIYTSQPGAHDPNWGNGPDSSSTPLLNLADFGDALFFDPSYNQAAINEILNPDEDFLNGLTECTIMCWIKSSEIDTDRGFLNFDDPAGNDQRGFRYDTVGAATGGDDVLKGGFSGPTSSNEIETSANMQTTDWQHVAMVWKAGENFKWYINSVEDTNADHDASHGPISDPLDRYEKIIVGRGSKDALGQPTAPNFGWHGLIDEVKIYDRALSAAEVLAASGIENTSPQVDAGNSFIAWFDDLPLTTLAGAVGDGPPGDVADADVVWSITDQPGGANASVTKTSSDWANPTAEFTTDTVGTYEITLTATDTTGLTESDTLEIQVAADACGAAQLSASWTGFNIYDSDQNCVIDLIDCRAFAAQWLVDLRQTAPEAY